MEFYTHSRYIFENGILNLLNITVRFPLSICVYIYLIFGINLLPFFLFWLQSHEIFSCFFIPKKTFLSFHHSNLTQKQLLLLSNFASLLLCTLLFIPVSVNHFCFSSAKENFEILKELVLKDLLSFHTFLTKTQNLLKLWNKQKVFK